MKPNVIVIHPTDNVAIALEDIGRGESVLAPGGVPFKAASDIAYSHKVLLRDAAAGAKIVKYGEVIGEAGQDLKQGEWVHTHNLKIGEE